MNIRSTLLEPFVCLTCRGKNNVHIFTLIRLCNHSVDYLCFYPMAVLIFPLMLLHFVTTFWILYKSRYVQRSLQRFRKKQPSVPQRGVVGIPPGLLTDNRVIVGFAAVQGNLSEKNLIPVKKFAGRFLFLSIALTFTFSSYWVKIYQISL